MKTLIHGGKIYSMRREKESFAAILIQDGVIRDTFPEKNEIPPSLITASEVTNIDLKGRTVLPGFIDTHTHSFEGGLYTLGVDLSRAGSLDEVFQSIREAQPVNGKIFAWRFDENNIAEARFPTMEELDRIQPDVPVLLRRVDGHSCVINSAAAKQIPWSSEKSMPLGQLRTQENSEASRWFHGSLEEDGILAAYAAAAEQALRYGVTTVHTMIGDGKGNAKHFETVRDNAGAFPAEFILYPQIMDVRKALELGSPRVGGCLLVDGSLGSRTAALLEPYLDRPGWTGQLYQTDEFWLSFVREAHAHDLQVAVHAIGDAAVSQILRVYLRVQQESPGKLQHQIIHNELTTNERMLDEMALAGVSAVMQPMFDRLWGGEDGFYSRIIGRERALQCDRLRSITDRGILLTGGSDWYITTLNALEGMDAAVRIHNPAERLTPWEAAGIYTSRAAELSGDHERIGRLLPGYQADLVILDTDPLQSGNFLECRVLSTLKKGNVACGEV